MDWVRGKKLGHGSFATVSLAVPRGHNPCQFPPLMAAKSCGASHRFPLMNEKLIMDELKDCPEIIQCYGESFSYENGEKLYNLLLEYASGGALSDKLNNSDDHKLPECEIRYYSKALLKGLHYIHKFGYVHCDIKLQNILLTSNGGVKIADFGLAKGVGEKRAELRGTPQYMSPEMLTGGEQGPPADIWAFGCVVAEVAAGLPPWRCSGGVAGLLMRIGVGEESPEIPYNLSEQGKDFLRKCFVKDPSKRWTAEMLLNDPFVSDDQDFDDGIALKDGHEISASRYSPRCPFDFPDCVSSASYSITSLPLPEYSYGSSLHSRPVERLRRVVSDQGPDWSVSDDWVTVR